MILKNIVLFLKSLPASENTSQNTLFIVLKNASVKNFLPNSVVFAVLAIFVSLFFSHVFAFCALNPWFNALTQSITGLDINGLFSLGVQATITFGPIILQAIPPLWSFSTVATGNLLVGGLVTVAGIQFAEWGYNWRYLISPEIIRPKYVEFFPKVKQALGLPSSGKFQYDFKANTFNYVAPQLTDGFISNEPEPSVALVPVETLIETIKTIHVEHHRKDILDLISTVNQIKQEQKKISIETVQGSSLEDLRAEIINLSKFEEAACLTTPKLSELYSEYNMPGANEEVGCFPGRIKIDYIETNTRLYFIHFNKFNSWVALGANEFKKDFPNIEKTIWAKVSDNGERTRITLSYDEIRTYFSSNFSINPEGCILIRKEEISQQPHPNPRYEGMILSEYQDIELPLLNTMVEVVQMNNSRGETRVDQVLDSVLAKASMAFDAQNTQDGGVGEEKNDSPIIESADSNDIIQTSTESVVTRTLGHTIGAASAMGAVTLLTNPHIFTVLGYLLLNEALLPLWNNPEAVHNLIGVYEANGIQPPEYLVQKAEELPLVSPRVTSDSISNFSSPTSNGIPIFWPLVLLGAGIGIYFGIKYYSGSPEENLAAAKTIAKTLPELKK